MSKLTKFSKLFEPGSIGSMKIRNRIVMPAMATNYADDDGQVTDLMIDHYVQRARGGVGLIITEVICPDFPRGKAGKMKPVSMMTNIFPATSDLRRLSINTVPA